MPQSSREEQRALIEEFYRQVTDGIPIDESWTKHMIEASTPQLPDRPSREQLDAWTELTELVGDPAFVASLRENTRKTWENDVDIEAVRATNVSAAEAAGHLRAEGHAPTSAEGRELVLALVDGIALASGRRADEEMRREVRKRFVEYDPRTGRYWQLLATINGQIMRSRVENWVFIVEAAKTHLP